MWARTMTNINTLYNYNQITTDNELSSKIPENDIYTLKGYEPEVLSGELLAVKQRNGIQELTTVSRSDINWKNKIFSWFNMGKLAHIKYDTSAVSSYLGKFNYKAFNEQKENPAQYEVYVKVCEYAGEALEKRYPKYKITENKDFTSPEIRLWVKNSDAKLYNLTYIDKDGNEQKRNYTICLNPAAKAKHLFLMEKFCDLYSKRDLGVGLVVLPKESGGLFPQVSDEAKITEKTLPKIHAIANRGWIDLQSRIFDADLEGKW